MPCKHKEEVVTEVTDLFHWMRKKSKNFDLDSVKNKNVEDIRELFRVWGGKKDRKPMVVAREIEDALDWWRRNDFELDEDSSPAEENKTQRLENLAQRWHDLVHPNMVPGTDANLDWFRNQNVGAISESLNLLGSSRHKSDSPKHFPGTLTEEQKRANEMASALDWLRSNDTELDVDDDASVALSVATFKKIDSLVPKSGDSGGITSMENALDWLRSKIDVDDETVNSFRKIDDVIAKSGVKDTIQESGFGGALDWLRKRQALKVANATDNGTHEKIEPVFTGPKTEEQKRAAEMAKALDWLRSNDAADDIDDDLSLGIGSVASFKNIDTSSTASGGGSLPSTLDWLRKQDKKSTPTVSEEDQLDSELAFTGIMNKSKEQKTANDMAKALDWMHDGVVQAIDDEDALQSVGIDTFSPVCADAQESRGLDDALNWLREKYPESISNNDDDEFSTLDSSGSKLRSKEQQKADQMGKALDWMRSNGVQLEDDAPDFSSCIIQYGSIDSELDDPEGEMARTLDWLHNKDVNNLDSDVHPACFGSGLKTKEQDQADAMTKALSWLKKKEVTLDGDESDIDFEKFDVGNFQPKTGEERAHEMQVALNWLRKSGLDVHDNESRKFQKLELLLPKKDRQSVGDRAKEMEDALNWLRSKGLDLDDDNADISFYDKLGIIPMGLRCIYERERDLKNAISWIQNADGEIENGNVFFKLDGLLPIREGQIQEDSANDMVNALAWLRANGVDVYDDDDDDSLTFGKIGTESIVHKSPEDREKDVEDVLGWLRQGENARSVESTFGKIEKLLPATHIGQSELERAKEMENALNWLRSKGIDIGDDKNFPSSFNKFSSTSVAKSSPEQRLKDLDNSINWIRKGKGKSQKYDPNGDFRKLDKLLPKKRSQTPEERAREIEGALDFLRSSDASPSDDDVVDRYSDLGFIPVSSRTPEQRHKDLQDIMNWIRHKGENDAINDPSGDFRNVDAVLPKKRGQTVKDRALQIETGLDWIRSSESLSKDGEMPSFDDIESVLSAHRSPEQRSEDSENVLNWLRRKGKKDKKYDPTGDFTKLDELLPKEKNQHLKDRARAIEGALDYIRNSGVSLTDDGVVEKLSKLGSVPISTHTPEQRMKDKQDALNWLRNKGKNDSLFDPIGEFKKLDSLLPKKKAQSLEDRAKDIEISSDWIRHKRIDDADSLLGLESAPPVDASRNNNPEQRTKVLSNALKWLRNKGNDDDRYDPDGEFRRLDGMLPKKRGQTSEDRAGEIEGSLDWLRQKAVRSHDSSVIDEHDTELDIVSSIPVSRRSIEQRSRDVDDILNWLRCKGQNEESTDPTGEFSKLDSMLPAKQGQKIDNRAREIECALDWCRNMDQHVLSDEKNDDLNFKKVTSIPMSQQTPEERTKDVNNILNWLRTNKGDNSTNDPNGDFTRLNNLLPNKTGQTLDERARDIEGVLDYTRNHSISTDGDVIHALCKVGNLPISRRSPEERKKDVNDVLSWIRGDRIADLDPSGEFGKLDHILPVKKKQSSKNRARDIECTLDWCRSLGVRPANIDSIPDSIKMNSIPIPVRGLEERRRELDNILTFLRSKSGNIGNFSKDFSKIDLMLPTKNKQTVEDRARDIESTLDWIRMAGLVLDEVETPLPSLDKLGSVSVHVRGTQERQRDLKNVLNWIRQGRQVSEDLTGEFTRIEGMLPYVKGEKSRERAQKIEIAIDWIRNKGILRLHDRNETKSDQSTEGSITVTRNSPEDNKKNIDNVIQWIRGGKLGDDDFSRNLTKIDQMLPVKKGQTLEERARAIESVSDWKRQTNLQLSPDITQDVECTKVDFVPITTRTQKERSKDLFDVITWLRDGKKRSDDPLGIFRQVDSLLPMKGGQNQRDRARNIENALDYCRNQDVRPSDDDITMPKFSKLSSIPVSHKSPEDRLNDVDNILQWIRSPGDGGDKIDVPADVKKIDQMLPVKKGESPEDRARDIESVFDYYRNQGVSPSDDNDSAVPELSKLSSIPASHSSPEDRLKDVDDVLFWLRNGKGNTLDPTGVFGKVDKILPKKKGQCRKDRALGIKNALTWMRNPYVPFVDSISVPLHVSKLSSDENNEIDNIMLWMRNNKDSIDDTTDGKFKLIDEILPTKKGESPLERATNIENALLWIRNVSPSVECDDTHSPAFIKRFLDSTPHTSPEDRKNVALSVLSWMRQGKPVNNNIEEIFSKVDQLLPRKTRQRPEERANDIESVIDWCRSVGVEPDEKSNKFQKQPPVLHNSSKSSPDDRTKDINDINTWIRRGKQDTDDTLNADFRKVDQMLPIRNQESPDERARDIEGFLDWCRNSGLKPIENGLIPRFDKASSIPVSRRSPEQRHEDLDDILTWLREGAPDSLDSTGDFKKISQRFPPNQIQTPDELANDIERTLDWTRNALPDQNEDDETPPFAKLASIPVTRRTPEDRMNDANDVITWIRRGKDAVDDKTGEFEVLDQLLPKKPLQKPEERARDIECLLDWVRSNNVNFSVEDPSSLEPMTGQPEISLIPRSPQERLRDLDRTMKWIRDGKPKDDDKGLTDEIKLVDQLLPKKQNETTEDRAEDIEGVLCWMRKNNMKLIDVNEPTDFKKPNQELMLSMRSPEDRAKDRNDALTWVRHKDGADVPELEPFKTIDQLLPTKPGQSSEDRAQEIENSYTWLRENGADIVEDNLEPFQRPANVDTNPGVDASYPNPLDIINNFGWNRYPRNQPGGDENSPFQKPGDLNLPRDRRVNPDEPLSVNEWSRQPNTKIPGVPAEYIPFDDLDNLYSIPRSRASHETGPDNVGQWTRSTNKKIPGAPDDDILFDRPADIGSVPRDGKPKNQGHPETVWQRTPNNHVPGIFDNDDVYDRPGDVKSVPRDGKPKNENSSHILWSRQPNQKIPQVPDRDVPLDRPDHSSIPRDEKPKMMEEPEYQWARKPSGDIPGFPLEDVPLDRIGTLNSIPRDRSPSHIKAPNDTDWRREPNERIPGVADERNLFDRPDSINSTPKTRQPIDYEPINDLEWARSIFSPPHEEQNNDDPFGRPNELNSVPYRRELDDCGPNDKPTEWRRSPYIPGIPIEEDVYNRPGDVKSVPRDGKPKNKDLPETSWQRTPKNNTPGVPDEDNIYDRPGDVKSVPRDGKPQNEDHPETVWQRKPNNNIPGIPNEDDVYNRPGDVKSIPRGGEPKNEYHPESIWKRTPNNDIPGISTEDNIYDRPGDVKSVPRDGKPKNKGLPETSWQRTPNNNVPFGPDDEDIYDRPGDVNSVPRDGKPKNEDHPESIWQRIPNDNIPGIPDEDDIYNRPGDVKSIPRDGRTKSLDEPEYGWQRVPVESKTDFNWNGDKPENSALSTPPSYDWSTKKSAVPVNRPVVTTSFETDDDFELTPVAESGDKPDNSAFSRPPSFDWSAKKSIVPFNRPVVTTPFETDDDFELTSVAESGDKPDNSAFSRPPSFDWSSQKSAVPFNRPVVTTPFETDDDFELTPVTEEPTPEASHKVDQPFYDWAGGRPLKLRSTPQPGDDPNPDMDWSADKPDNTWYKKEEPQYDWSGARPEGPFDRPSVTTATESDNDLELAAIPDDDMSEYEEEDEDKQPTVTGVPLAGWSMLALGAVAGAGATVGGSTGIVPSPSTPQFSLENPNQPSPTDSFFPDPESLVPCTTDPACQIVSDGLGPYIPPGTAELFDIPGTCQSKARDWLRTGEDVLEFNGERIRQRFAMTVFFCEQDGGEWLENDMWLSDLHECDWYNMIGLDPCNRVEQMEMIRISGNGLQGTLPSELSILSTIYEFTASDNLITGTFPGDYSGLTELDTLVVAFNQFSGKIPSYFFRYPDMVYWDVGFNKFEGTLPQDIPEQMPNLQVMFGENNQLSGTIPANLGTLDLKSVHLDDNNLTGTIPSTLGNPPNLESLFLHGNSFEGTIPDTLPNKLRDATFHYNSLKGDVSKNICEQMYQGNLQSISVDCETVTCECCICGEPGV